RNPWRAMWVRRGSRVSRCSVPRGRHDGTAVQAGKDCPTEPNAILLATSTLPCGLVERHRFLRNARIVLGGRRVAVRIRSCGKPIGAPVFGLVHTAPPRARRNEPTPAPRVFRRYPHYGPSAGPLREKSAPQDDAG